MDEELTPRERRHHRTQQAILDAALELIHENGVDGISIRSIAEKIDYSPAGLYEYYGSKEEIISALCIQGFQRFARHLSSVDQTLPAGAYMIELGMAYVNFALNNPDFFLLMFTTAPMSMQITKSKISPSGEKSEGDEAFLILLRGVERCVVEGMMKPQPNFGVLEMAQVAWSLSHGIAMLQLTALQRMPMTDDTIRHAFSALFDGSSQ